VADLPHVRRPPPPPLRRPPSNDYTATLERLGDLISLRPAAPFVTRQFLVYVAAEP
jgi:hypothetical protein